MNRSVINLQSIKLDAVAYGSQGSAVLGIRDSGKTNGLIEEPERGAYRLSAVIMGDV